MAMLAVALWTMVAKVDDRSFGQSRIYQNTLARTIGDLQMVPI